MTGALAALVAAGIALPHVLHLERVQPTTAIVVWLSSLTLRALAGALAVVLLLFFLPRTPTFTAATHWCLHVGIPFVGEQLDIEGHGLADRLLLVPGAALAVSLIVACYRTACGARLARRLLKQDVVGLGPRESLIVRGSDVLLAVAGLVRPRIVVSAGALACLDDEELGAGLDHERGHIVRRHRYVMLVAVACAALGRAVPGTRQAIRQLAFHLERDADRWALKQRNDRLALASVICKAATADTIAPPAFARVGSTGVRERVRQLTTDTIAAQRRATAAAVNGLATVMVLCTLLLAAAVPAAAVSGIGADVHRGHHAGHCRHA